MNQSLDEVIVFLTQLFPPNPAVKPDVSTLSLLVHILDPSHNTVIASDHFYIEIGYLYVLLNSFNSKLIIITIC